MIDHLVLATPHLRESRDAIEFDWGIAMTPGGAHLGVGTRNELTGLGGSMYLEVIGPDEGQPAPALPRPFGVDNLSEPRLVAWCARPTRPLEEVIAACAELGLDLGGVSDMCRARPDGVVLRWRLTFPFLDLPHAGTVPFVIDWLDSEHPAASLPHECTLRALHLHHPDPAYLGGVLGVIGSSSAIEIAPGAAGIAATIRTPRGEQFLSG